MCEVKQLSSDQPIPWDTDISLIHAEEVYVKVLDKFPIMTHISHQVSDISASQKRVYFVRLVVCKYGVVKLHAHNYAK